MIIPYRRFMDAVFAEPFRPFRVHTTNGRTFELRYEESVCLGRSTLTVRLPAEDDPDYTGPWQNIPLDSISAIEPLDVPASLGA